MVQDGFAIEVAIAKKKPLPKWLDDEPDTQPLDGFFLSAFDDLNTCRADGGAIPWRDIMLYGKEYTGLDHDTLRVFIKVMREMDRAFLKWHNKKDTMKKSRRSKPSVSRPPPRRRSR